MHLEEQVIGGSPEREPGFWEEFVWSAVSGGVDQELVLDHVP